jgi:hypothetical protein
LRGFAHHAEPKGCESGVNYRRHSRVC